MSVESLAEEFLDRLRRGEQPEIEEYAERYPALAREIREFFPALRLVEKFKPASRDEPVVAKSAGRGRSIPDFPERVPERLGDFRILREISRGGMGIVYEAVQESLGRPVALKVLPSHALLDARQKKRFVREARAAARLHHTNIVPVFGVGEAGGVHYYAMQFIPGLGLNLVLDELRRLRAAVPQPASMTGNGDGEAAAAPAGPATRPDAINSGHGESAEFVAQSLVSGRFALERLTVAYDPSSNNSGSGERRPKPTRQPGSDSLPSRANRENLPESDDETIAKRLSDTAAFVLRGREASTSGRGAWSAYWQSVARIGVQVGEALQYAHDHGVLHRDIKPSNLLLDAHGTAWVTDFGLAKADDQDDLTRTGDVLGTLRYIAPEVFHGKADCRSDVYSLGLTLYELLAMRPAFDETNRHKLVSQVMHHAPSRLPSVDRNIPRDLETIVHKAIDRDPSQRYQAAVELADDLRRFLGDQPIRARRISYATRLARWCRRNPGIAGLTAALSALLLTIGVGGAIWATQAEKARIEIAASEYEATRRLYDSYVSQAYAGRWSRRPGQRVMGLDALKNAAALVPRLDLGEEARLKLRNGAIASMGLIDIVKLSGFQRPTRDWWITFDPQLQRYVRLDASNRLFLWRHSDHRRLDQIPVALPEAGGILSQFTSTGRYLVGVDASWRAWAWDLAKKHIVMQADVASYTRFSVSDDVLAIVGRDYTVQLFDLRTASRIAKIPTKAQAVSLSPDGTKAAIVTTGNSRVEIWDCATPRQLRVLSIPSVERTVWSPNGKLLAAGAFDTIIVINLESGRAFAELKGHQNAGLEFCFNHDGSLLASTAWDGSARLWNPYSGRELLREVGYRCELHGRNDTLVLASATDVQIWRLVRSTECQRLRIADNADATFRSCDFWSDGPVLATARDDGIRIWNLRSKQELAFAPIRGTGSIVFHHATESLISASPNGVYRWPINSSDDGERWQVGPPELLQARVGAIVDARSLVLSGDGRSIAAVTGDQEAHVFALDDSGQKSTLKGHAGIARISISPDGRWVASGAYGRLGIKVWNAATGELIDDVWPECVDSSISFSPDGKWMAAVDRPQLRIFDTASWKLAREFPIGRLGRGLAWSPDSRLIIVSVHGLPKLFDSLTGAEVAAIEPVDEAGNLETFQFSSDGGQLAIVRRHAVEVWDLRRVRSRLTDMGVDWDLPSLPPPAPVKSPPREVSFDLGLLAPGPLEIARQHTLSGDWLAAAREYERAYEAKTNHDLEELFDISAGLLLGGHVQQYRDLLPVLLERHASTDDGRVAYLVARIAVLRDDEPLDPTIHKLAEFSVKSDEQCPWYLHALGLVCLREDDLEQAKILLQKSAQSNWEANVSNWSALAIVYRRLGDVDKSDQFWQQAKAGMANLTALHPHDRVAAKLLHDEAEKLLGN